MAKLKHFGEHITIDGYGGDVKRLDDGKVIRLCIKNLPGLLRMRTIGKPKVHKVAGNGHKDPGGWSGVVLIMESHISIHTFPKRRFVSIDVYSCTNGLNQKAIINYFKKAYKLQSVETNFLLRGKRYPAH